MLHLYKKTLLIALTAFATQTMADELIEAEVGVLTAGELVSSDNNSPLIERTENKDQAGYTKSFNYDLKRLIRLEENKILIMSNGGLGINVSENGWTNDFIIKNNQKFKAAMDDHGATEYQLINIGEESVTIKYTSEFDHSSFGHDKITIDEGTIEINYKN